MVNINEVENNYLLYNYVILIVVITVDLLIAVTTVKV